MPEHRRGIFYGKRRRWVAVDPTRGYTGQGRTRRAAIANLAPGGKELFAAAAVTQ